MKGYGTADLTLQYAVSKALSLQFNVNNLTNSSGVLSWLAPGPFPANNNLEAVTPAYIKANPTAVFSALRNQPRSYFLTASYKF